MPTKGPTINLHHHFIKKNQQHHNFLLITPTKWKNIISEYRVVGLVLRNVITHVSSRRDENRHQQQWLRKGICESIVIK